MRVLFISEGFDEKSIIAQPWRYTYEIANQLVRQQHEVALATDSPYTSTRRETIIRGIPAYILPKTRLPPVMSLRMDPHEVRSTVKEFSPDVIYWDGGALIGNYIRRLKSINIPIAVHISSNVYSFKNMARAHAIQEYRSRGHSFLIYVFAMSSPLARPLICLLNQKAINLITVPNLAIKRKLIEKGLSGSKIEIMPTPFYEDGVFPNENMRDTIKTRQKIGLDMADFIVTYFGPSPTYRGTDTLLYAVAKLKRKLPHLKLLMLLRQTFEREDTVEKRLRKLVSRLMLGDSVKFTQGLLERADLIRFIQTSSAIALPFKFLLNEPPLSALETMALGRPLITTRVSGLPELVGNDRGLLIKPGNANELAKAIYYVAKNPEEANALGRRAADYISKLPDWSKLAKYLLSLFEHFLN